MASGNGASPLSLRSAALPTVNGIQLPSTLSPFRYPGGKTGLRNKIIDWIRTLGVRPTNFIEPFAGGSSVGLAIAELNLADRITLIEIDPDVASVWKTILGGKASILAARIRAFELTEAAAHKVAEQKHDDLVSRAFRCLLLNRISRGGITAPGAGWLKRGERGRGIHSRWYPETLAKRIEAIEVIRTKIHFSEGDGLKALRDYRSSRGAVAFVDPPYVAQGRGAGVRLYSHYDVDCGELFRVARQFSGPMVITYHRSEIVRREAAAAGIACHTVTMHTAHTVSKRQLILYKPASSGWPASNRCPRNGADRHTTGLLTGANVRSKNGVSKPQ